MGCSHGAKFHARDWNLYTFIYLNDQRDATHANSTFIYVARLPCLFCFEAICDRYFTAIFNRDCFKLIG
jgi:deoxycytidylate deaminase